MIYLDDSALSKPRKEVIEIVNDVLKNHWYNPNSVYDEGLEANRMILNAKRIIAKEINCSPECLVMCASGSEANTTAIMGYMKENGMPHVITSVLEHASILENPYAKVIVKVDNEGRYDMDIINGIHDKFVSLCFANSEIGTIQDIKNITKVLHDNRCILHTDATAAFGKIKINVKDLDIDMMTFASQKIGGILGAACLYIKPGIKIAPLIYGHDPLRNGTPNTASICGFGKAVELIDYEEVKEIKEKRDYFINELLQIPNVTLNGSKKYRLPNNINICIHNIELDSQQLIALFDVMNYCCSAASACNAGDRQPSKTLLALGLSSEEANHSLRLTISNDNTIAELEAFVKDLKNIIEQISKRKA